MCVCSGNCSKLYREQRPKPRRAPDWKDLAVGFPRALASALSSLPRPASSLYVPGPCRPMPSPLRVPGGLSHPDRRRRLHRVLSPLLCAADGEGRPRMFPRRCRLNRANASPTMILSRPSVNEQTPVSPPGLPDIPTLSAPASSSDPQPVQSPVVSSPSFN